MNTADKEFIQQVIWPWNRARPAAFSKEIWQAMGKQGLHKKALPKTFGGDEAGYGELYLQTKFLMSLGGNMGLTMAWLYEQLVAKFVITELANSEQQRKIFPGLRQGYLLLNLAISEPQAGAHPKYLQSAAVPKNNGYVLNGEKSYLTLGPVADLFIVLTQTGTQGQHRLFSAFLIPRNTPGISFTDPLNFPSLQTCPHCGLKMDKVELLKDDLLGEKDKAWDQLVIPFARREEVLMLGMLCGALDLELQLTIRADRQLPKAQLGELRSMIQALEELGLQAALALDRGQYRPDLSIFCKQLVQDLQADFKTYLPSQDNSPDSLLHALCMEIDWLSRLGEKNMKKKQERLAEHWLSQLKAIR